jgi:hypothetical protein
MFHAAVAEITEKGIPGAERQKTKLRSFIANGLGKQAVHDFVRGSVTADCDEISGASFISIARDLGRVPGRTCAGDRYVKTGVTKTLQGGAEKLAAASAAGCWIRDR